MLAQTLRARGAEVSMVGLRAQRLVALESFEPEVVIAELSAFYGPSWEMVSALWQHVRLRWIPILLVPDLESVHAGKFDLEELGHALQTLRAPYERVMASLSHRQAFELSLSVLGPPRTLRALLADGKPVHATFKTRRARIELDLAEHRVLRVRAGALHGSSDRTLGTAALDWLMSREHGTVLVRPSQAHEPAEPDECDDETTTSAPTISGIRPPAYLDDEHEPPTVRMTMTQRELENVGDALRVVRSMRLPPPLPPKPAIQCVPPPLPRAPLPQAQVVTARMPHAPSLRRSLGSLTIGGLVLMVGALAAHWFLASDMFPELKRPVVAFASSVQLELASWRDLLPRLPVWVHPMFSADDATNAQPAEPVHQTLR
jgi:hypothetical protein